jgi:hypothetical protein
MLLDRGEVRDLFLALLARAKKHHRFHSRILEGPP